MSPAFVRQANRSKLDRGNRRSDRQGQKRWREPAAHHQPDETIETIMHTSALIEPDHAGTQHQQGGIELYQDIEKPEMRERKLWQHRRPARRAGQGAAMGKAGCPEHGHAHQREQDRPANHERQRDAPQAIPDEAPGPVAMKAQMGKEARDQEEGRHPKHVNDKEQYAEDQAWMAVLDDPDSGRCRDE
jgi:hypothetical protein